MRRPPRATASAGLIVALALAAPGLPAAQVQYRGIPFPPYEFYEALIQQSEDADFSAMTQSIAYLTPLFRAVQERFAADPRAEIEQAIAGRDATRARAAVLRLVFLDLKLNLDEAASVPTVKRRKELLQIAYTDYYFLSGEVGRRDRALDRELRQLFRSAYASTDSAGSSQSIGHLMGKLAVIFGETPDGS